MTYFGDLNRELEALQLWLDLRKEQGAQVDGIARETRVFLRQQAKRAEKLDAPPTRFIEPASLVAIRRARPKGPRKLDYRLSDAQLYDRMLGAVLGRSAGCVLGIPVEGRSRDFIKGWAEKIGQAYPLQEFWKGYPALGHMHYGKEWTSVFCQPIDHVGPDDDLAYTLLGLLILEECGVDFTSEDVGRKWLQYLPIACTAEHVALENLKKGLKPPRTATRDNPFSEWIGADIRSDPWGYAAPGLPEKAAEFAYRDAIVSHVRNGVYGEMFFSAAISAAFVESDMERILSIALSEIPARCRMARTVRETIRWCKEDRDWGKTWERVAARYAGMSGVHTLNNAAITIMGLLYGEGDFDRTIGYAVMGGFDTDCNGATAGSIAGAVLGASRIPPKWTVPFNDEIHTYLNGCERFSITDVAQRFCEEAKAVRASAS